MTTTEYVPRPQAPTRIRIAVIVIASALVALQAGTQAAAQRLGYHEALGEPLLDVSAWLPGLAAAILLGLAGALLWATGRARLGIAVLAGAGGAWALGAGPLYRPTDLVAWTSGFLGEEVFQPVMETAVVAAAGGFIGAMLLLHFAWDRGFRLKRSTSHGSSRWGDLAPLLKAGGKPGFLLGKKGPKKLQYSDDGHLLTVAPTRSGKGVGPIISTLLSYPGSVVVTDPKGENYAVTHAYRKGALYNQVVALDPFGLVGGSGAVNPLDVIDAEAPSAIDEARSLAETIVVSRGGPSANAAFFDEEARGLLAGFILYVCHGFRGEQRSLSTVREMITRPPERFEALLEEMSSMPGACHGLVARTANRILQKDERERSGVISTAQSHTHFLDSPQVAQSLSCSTIDLSALKRLRVTVYLILPMDKLDAYAPFLRLVVTSAIMAIVQEKRPARERVLFLLDEFANMGRLESVLRAVTLLAGYGASVWMFIQNLAQLKAVYADKWEVLLDVDVFQAFGTNDLVTADYVSRLTGEATVFSSTQADSRSSGKGGRGRQRSFTMAEKRRRLLTPDEVMRLPKGEQLVFLKGHQPMRAERVRYFEDEELRARAEANPMHAEPAL